jgi:general secretion pathway protein F
MTLISYRAYDGGGLIVSGQRDGRDEHDVVSKLRQEGLIPFEIKPAGVSESGAGWLNREIGGQRLRTKDRARFLRILSALLGAGVPIDRSLQLMSNPTHGKRMSTVAAIAAGKIASGQSLSAALNIPEARFAKHEIGLMRSAEQTGQFLDILDQLARLLDKQVDLRGKLTSALVYPLVLLAMSLVSLAVIMTVLIPNLLPLIADSDKPLPLILRALVATQGAVTEHAIQISLATVVAIALLAFVLSSEWGRRLRQSFMLRFDLFRKTEATRIYRTLGTLIKNGVPLQLALRLTGETVKTQRTQREFDESLERLVAGARLAAAIDTVGVIDDQSRQLIAIGEESNRVDELLLYLADSNDADIARRLERAMTLLTPALTLLLGLLIGGLILSVMRVILSVNELAL